MLPYDPSEIKNVLRGKNDGVMEHWIPIVEHSEDNLKNL